MICDAFHAFSTSNQKFGQKLHLHKYDVPTYLGCKKHVLKITAPNNKSGNIPVLILLIAWG